jgi:hypothetical protein
MAGVKARKSERPKAVDLKNIFDIIKGLGRVRISFEDR